MLLFVLNFLPQTFQTITWSLYCQIVCCLGVPNTLKVFSQTLHVWTLSLLCAFSYHTDHIQQQHDFPHEPALAIFRSTTPLNVLLKADPSLEGDVADDKVNPSACHQLGQVFLQYFWGMAGSMDHQQILDGLDFLKKFYKKNEIEIKKNQKQN